MFIFKIIALLTGLWIIGLALYVVIKVSGFIFWSIYDALLDSALYRKLLRSEKLIVSRKRHIAPHEIVDKRLLMLENHMPVGYITRTAPQQDMWIILVDIPVGPFKYNDLAFEVDQTVWLGLAPGDELDNPHFGGFKPEAVVDMDIQEWLLRTSEA